MFDAFSGCQQLLQRMGAVHAGLVERAAGLLAAQGCVAALQQQLAEGHYTLDVAQVDGMLGSGQAMLCAGQPAFRLCWYLISPLSPGAK